jgi:hypothetical protein
MEAMDFTVCSIGTFFAISVNAASGEENSMADWLMEALSDAQPAKRVLWLKIKRMIRRYFLIRLRFMDFNMFGCDPFL